MNKVLGAWDRFWFTPRPTSTAAVVRVAGALVLLASAVTLGPDVLAFFGPEAIMPRQPAFEDSGLRGVWSALGRNPSATLVIGLYVVLVVGALCLLVGFHSRLAALAVFVAMVSFTRRTPVVFNSGDALLRNLSFYLLLVPGGAALSVDRWRKVRKARRRGDGEGAGTFWAFPARAVWPLRLMQIQLSVAYLTAVWAKVVGSTWREGTAVVYALQVDFVRRLPLPGVFVESVLLSNILTFGTLATELAIGLLVWSRRARPVILWVGVAFHLALDYAFRVGFFSYAMFVLYLAFIPPETMEAWLSRGRERLALRRERRRSTEAEGSRPEGDVDPAAEVAPADAVVGDSSAGVGRG